MFSLGYMYGQNQVNTHRLLGTRLDHYDTNTSPPRYVFSDSTSYTYSGFNESFSLHSPHVFLEGLEGRIAVIEPLLPYLYTGLFPPLSNAIVQPYDRIQFDSLLIYTYDETENEWDIQTRKKRQYTLNQPTHEVVLDKDVLNYVDTMQKLIMYDDRGNVVKYTALDFVFAEGETDTTAEYTFAYANDQLVQYTQYVWVLDQRYRGMVTDYTYNEKGLVSEEVKTYYTLDAANLPYQHNKYQAIYNNADLVIEHNRFLKYAGVWHMSEQRKFDFDGDQLLKYTYLWRIVDTTPTLSLSVWDTLIRKDYYWSDAQLDSILTLKNGSGLNYNLNYVMREEMAYSDSKLTRYTQNYISAAEPATFDYTFAYNEKGMVVLKSGTSAYPLSPYFTRSDSIFTYDSYDNLIKTELLYGNSYTSINHITLEPARRKYFYYGSEPIAGSTDGSFSIHAYPSPTNDLLNVHFLLSDNTSGEAELQMFSADGKQVMHLYQSVLNNSFMTIDCSKLLSGMYFISATVNGYRAYQPIVVR